VGSIDQNAVNYFLRVNSRPIKVKNNYCRKFCDSVRVDFSFFFGYGSDPGEESRNKADSQYWKMDNSNEKEIKIAVFWVVAPCSLVEVYQRFRSSP
jgi:hypothetical protein